MAKAERIVAQIAEAGHIFVLGQKNDEMCPKPKGGVSLLFHRPSCKQSRRNQGDDLKPNSAVSPEHPHSRKAAQQAQGSRNEMLKITRSAGPHYEFTGDQRKCCQQDHASPG